MFKVRVYSDAVRFTVLTFNHAREAWYTAHSLVREYSSPVQYGDSAYNAEADIFADGTLVGILTSASYNRGVLLIPANEEA